MGHRHRTEDQIFIDQSHRLEQNNWELQRGMEVTMNFMPEAPGLALFARHPKRGEPATTGYPDGSHCDMAEISRLGFRQYAKHIPYWKNYMWPTPTKSHLNEGRPVRWHGAGALRWKTLLYGADVACDVRNAKFENGCLKPAGQHLFTEVWYHFKLPFLISWVSIDYDVVGAGSDYFGLSLSADDRRSWWPLQLPSRAPHYGVASNGQAEWQAGESSVQGLQEFWLRVDMVSHSPEPALAVQGFNVAVGFQHNMHLQPRLVPGANPLWLEASELAAGATLEAEWIYQIDGQERRSVVALGKAGCAEENVSLDVGCPSEILMTAVKLNCK